MRQFFGWILGWQCSQKMQASPTAKHLPRQVQSSQLTGFWGLWAADEHGGSISLLSSHPGANGKGVRSVRPGQHHGPGCLQRCPYLHRAKSCVKHMLHGEHGVGVAKQTCRLDSHIAAFLLIHGNPISAGGQRYAVKACKARCM